MVCYSLSRHTHLVELADVSTGLDQESHLLLLTPVSSPVQGRPAGLTHTSQSVSTPVTRHTTPPRVRCSERIGVTRLVDRLQVSGVLLQVAADLTLVPRVQHCEQSVELDASERRHRQTDTDRQREERTQSSPLGSGESPRRSYSAVSHSRELIYPTVNTEVSDC